MNKIQLKIILFYKKCVRMMQNKLLAKVPLHSFGIVALKRAVWVRVWFSATPSPHHCSACVFLGSRTAWMFGRTPPCAMVTPERS